MFLSPKETARIMSAVEKKKVSRRKVYYLLDIYIFMGIKFSQNTLRIHLDELIFYYGRKYEQIIKKSAYDINRERSFQSALCERKNRVSSSKRRRAYRVQGRRENVELPKRGHSLIYRKKNHFGKVAWQPELPF